MTLIKRYPNRKLYDTQARRYITLSEIAGLIRHGEEIQVIDYASGEDLTARILSQVITDQEKLPGGFVPRPVLTGLVRAGGNTLEAVRRALLTTLDFSHQVDAEIQRRIELLIQNGDLAEAEGRQLLDRLLALSPAPLDLSTAVERALVERGAPSREDLNRLQAQIEALTEHLSALYPEQ